MMICATARAATYTWNGGTSGVWASNSNWTPAGIPGSGDLVYIRQTATIDIGSSATPLEVDGISLGGNGLDESFTVTLTGNGTLNVTGTNTFPESAADKGIVTWRPTATSNDAVGWSITSSLILDCTVNATNIAIHSGGKVTITENHTVKVNGNVTNIAYNNNTPTTISVSGALIANTITLADYSNQELTINSGALVSATSISTTGGTVTNNGGTNYTRTAGDTDYVWLGAHSTNWNDTANWSLGSVPNAATAVAKISAATRQPVIANGTTIDVQSITFDSASESLTNDGTLRINGNFTNVSNIATASTGTVKVTGELTNSSPYDSSTLAYECASLAVSANLQCKSMKVTGTSSLTNTSGNTYLVATGNDGISFGGTVTASSTGTQFILGGNIKASSATNIDVTSGLLNHVKENTNNHTDWSSYLTVDLKNDGTSFGLQGQSYNIKVSATPVAPATTCDVYLVGSGTIKSFTDSSTSCNIHFGNGQNFTNEFTFDSGITFQTTGSIIFDQSCHGLTSSNPASPITLSGIKTIDNQSANLTNQLGVNFSLIDNATITGNAIKFNDVTLAGTTEISGSNEFVNLTASGLGGKTLTINGTQTTITGTFDLSGTSTSSKLTVEGAGTLRLTNLLVAEYLNFTGTGPAISSGTAFAGNSSWPLAGAPAGWIVVDGTQHVWNGSTTAWGTATNWLPQSVPDGNTEEVIINTSVSSTYPVISSGVTLKSITINAGTVTVNGTGSSLTLAQGTELDTNIKGTGKLILPSGQSFTITGPKEFDINIENSGTLSCTTGAVTFDKTIENKASSTFSTSVAITATEFIYNSNNNLTFTEAAAIDELSITSTGAVAFSKTLDSTSSVSITSGTLSFGDAVNVKDITMNATTTTSSDITVTGNWTNTGTFAASSPSLVKLTTISSDTSRVVLSGANTFYDLNLDRNVNVTGSNTMHDLIMHSTTGDATDKGNIYFGANTKQTISGKLDFKGLTTKQLLAKCITNGSTWEIECTGSNTHELQNINLRGCVNSSSYTLVVSDPVGTQNGAKSQDSGENSNFYFLGHKYTWVGGATGHLNDWNWAANWSPDSIPGKGTEIEIPNGKTYYPILTAELNLTYDTSYKGKITIAAGTATLSEGKLDLGGQDVTAGEIVNNGRVRLTGAAGQTITLTRTNKTNSVVEYYLPSGSNTTITNNAWGQNYENLDINAPVNFSSSALTINASTKIAAGSGKTVNLNNSGNVFKGTVFIGDSSTSVNAGDVTLNGTGNPTAANTTIFLANNTLASQITLNSNVQGGTLTITAPVTLNNSLIYSSEVQTYNNPITLGTTGNHGFNGSQVIFNNTVSTTVAGTSIEVTGPVTINCTGITTTGTQTYHNNVTLNQTTTLSASTVSLIGNVSNAVTAPAATLTINADTNIASANVTITTAEFDFSNDITVSAPSNALTLNTPIVKSIITSGTANITLNTLTLSRDNTILTSANASNISITANKIDGIGKQLTLSNNIQTITFSNGMEIVPVLKIEKVPAIVFAGSATLDDNVLIGTAGDGSDIDKSFYSSGAGIITIKKDLIIDALDGKKVALNCALNSAATSSAGTIRANNVVLYSGDVYLYGNLSSKIDGATSGDIIWGDIIILGNTNYSTADSGVAKTYYYNQTRLSSPSFNPSGAAAFTEPFRSGPYEAVLNTMGSATITVGKNFYTNGTTLQSASSDDWSIELPDISDAVNGFAEAIQTTVSNCKVSCWADPSNTATDDTAPAKVVAYECTVDTTNTNWNSEAFSILEAYTVRDNAILVKFNAPVRNRRNEINNADGSSGTIQYLQYQNATGSTASFEGIYSDPDCQTRIINLNITTNEAGGYKLYIKAPSSWNTDATGKSEGTSKSSDRYGNHKSALPYLDIPRSLAGSGSANPITYIITNKWGKRLDNYSPRTNSGIAYGSTADTTHDVEDKTGPVLWTVRTGQELHDAYDAAVGETSQHSYDSHNFLEFRYSEPVDIGTITAYSAGTTPNVVENIQVTDALGAITGNIALASSEITFAGLARFTAPAGSTDGLKLYTGLNGAVNKYMNALYRLDEYSVRLSVAGWTDGTVEDYSTNEYKKWAGYIEDATQFTGATAHTVAATNSLVKDQQGNEQIEYAANKAEPLIYSDSTADASALLPVSPADVYSTWDLSSPVFTPLRFSSETTWGDQTMSEAIGNTNGSGSTLDRIDFHFFDNTPAYNGSDPAVWYTEIGWCITGTDASKDNLLDASYTYCADIIGGARQFDTVAARRTTGGIRFSTKAEISTAFKYSTSQNNPVPSSPFLTGIGNVHTTVVSQLFTGSSTPMRSANDPDGLYLGLSLSDTNLSVETTFSFSYSEGQGYLTDLAGNRLRNKTSKTIDRTPPSFDVILSPVDSKSIYIIFVKQLVTNSEKIKFRTNAGANIPISESFETLMPKCFRIITIDENGNAVVSTKNQIDTNVPAQIVEENTNNSFTCIKLTTKNDITIDDVKNMYIQLILPDPYQSNYPTGTLDPLTNNINSRVTFIQDLLGNYMSLYGAHALSDFAINYVNPLYAYSTDMTTEEMSVMNGLYEEGSWAVHDFNADQQNYGTLPANHPVSIVADTKSESNMRVYLSASPDEGSVAEQFNLDFGASLRVWLPDLIDGSFRAFAAGNNKNFAYTDGELLSSESSNSIFNVSSDIANTWESGNQVTFLFGLMKDATTPLRIYNTPYYNIATDSFDFTQSGSVPLYSLRMTDINDINTLDLWSFKLKSITNQRGGVTILNNVINATKGEHVVVKVDMPENGRLNVIVMTLDGNIISYLNRGKVEAGENYFTWDGKNRNGNSVARGMYFVRVTGPGIDETRKVMVVKD